MGLSGVGSTYSYIYNSQTKQLSTKDGTQDEFVLYFNGDLEGNSTEELNGFDANKKRDIENMIMLFEQAGLAKDVIAGNTEIEISGEIVDASTSNYFVNGQKVFTAYNAVSYTYDEVGIFTGRTSQCYKTHQSKGYDASDNSMNIAVGDMFDLGNGYRLLVKEDCVQCVGIGNGEDEKAKQLAYGLNAFIHFADQQWPASWIDKETSEMLIAFLNELGIDTEKEFTINDTKCEVKNGRIREVGNDHVIPSSMYTAALKRYEELLYQPLSEGNIKEKQH